MFLGVSKESKAYRFVDPVTNKIVISRDVKFDENEKGKGKDQLEWPDNSEGRRRRRRRRSKHYGSVEFNWFGVKLSNGFYDECEMKRVRMRSKKQNS